MEIIIRRTAFKEGYTIGNLYILPEQAGNEKKSMPTPAKDKEIDVPKQIVNEEKAMPKWFCNTMEPTARKLTSQMSLTLIRRHKIIYCCPIKPLYTAISSLNPAEIGMISSYFKFQAPLE